MKKRQREEVFEEDMTFWTFKIDEALVAFEEEIEATENTDKRVSMAVYQAFVQIKYANEALVNSIAYHQNSKKKTFWSCFKK